MIIFKFGGASVKDSNSINNVISIIEKYKGNKIIIIVSAIGKTTNLLEDIYDSIIKKNNKKFEEKLKLFYDSHYEIIKNLNIDKEIITELEYIKSFLKSKFENELSDNFYFEYDQIVSLGEIISSKILEIKVKSKLGNSEFLDARKLIRTDNNFKQSDIDWKKTDELINKKVNYLFQANDVLVCQGFIGHTNEGFTTTLGREGSDFSAAIFAYCLNAEYVIIWKDVPGMLNADPKYFSDAIKLDSISYKEAIELAYYGASVIHPKTIKPLQNKNIPLYIKSFYDVELKGSVIQLSEENDALFPSYIYKMKQILYSLSSKDFSFINEEDLSNIFLKLSLLKVKVNLMQNSALSFSFAIDQDSIDINNILKCFEDKYTIKYNKDLELLTIRHYNDDIIKKETHNMLIILEQKTRTTVRFLLKEKRLCKNSQSL